MIFDRLFGKPKSDKPDGEEKVGAFERLRRGLGKTRDALTSLFGMGRKLDDDLLEEVETLLIESDLDLACRWISATNSEMPTRTVILIQKRLFHS